MEQFIAEHPFIFAVLCVLALIVADNIGVSWAQAWVARKIIEKEGAK